MKWPFSYRVIGNEGLFFYPTSPDYPKSIIWRTYNRINKNLFIEIYEIYYKCPMYQIITSNTWGILFYECYIFIQYLSSYTLQYLLPYTFIQQLLYQNLCVNPAFTDQPALQSPDRPVLMSPKMLLFALKPQRPPNARSVQVPLMSSDVYLVVVPLV